MRVEDRGPSRVLWLSRPERRNALGRETIEAMVRAIEDAGDEESVRGIVLAAEGDVFAAGGDLGEIVALLEADDGAEQVLRMGERLGIIEECAVPVVAAVAGNVFGGGCELLLLCDAVFVERGRELTFRHAAMGLCPAWGGASRLLARVGPLTAARLLMTGDPVGADEGEKIGLVTRSVDAGEALPSALAFVERVARLDRSAVTAQKRALAFASSEIRGEADDATAAVLRAVFGGPAHRAAMARFTERKRCS